MFVQNRATSILCYIFLQSYDSPAKQDQPPLNREDLQLIDMCLFWGGRWVFLSSLEVGLGVLSCNTLLFPSNGQVNLCASKMERTGIL